MNRKNLLLEKLKKEIKEFESSMIQKEPQEIYYRAYEIDCMNDIYEELVKRSQEMDETTVETLLSVSELLAFFYQRWLKYEDTLVVELGNCISTEIEKMVQKEEGV